VPVPAIAHRSDWGADERLMDWSPEYAGPVKAVAFHHTATANTYDPVDVPRILRAIYYYQAVSRGWGDVGYTALVDRFGRLWEGRYGGLARPVVGAHAGGFNRYTAGDRGDRRLPHHAGAGRGRRRRRALRRVEALARAGRGPARSGAPDRRRLDLPASGEHHGDGAEGVPARPDEPHRVPGSAGTGRARPGCARRRTGTWESGPNRRRCAPGWPSGGRPTRAGTSSAGPIPALTGTVGDVPAPADFDGDGSADPATWSPLTGRWQIRNSSGGTAGAVHARARR
jgi:hypothetical protein